MTTTQTTHPFAGFGPAPYRVVNVTEKVHVIPGVCARAGGCCDVCGACIRWAYTVRASNGVEFVTGCDCALKAGMTAAEIKEARRAYRRERDREEWTRSTRAREAEERAANFERCGYSLTNVEISQAEAQGKAAAKVWLKNQRRYDAQHIGTIGKRARGLELLVERCHSFDTAYGAKTIWILRDRAGNQIVLKTTTSLGMDTEDGRWEGVQRFNKWDNAYSSRWFRADATVKEHSSYEGMRQTVIQRAKVTAILSDWIERE